MNEDKHPKETDEASRETHRYSKAARYGARIALIVFVLILGAAVYHLLWPLETDGGAAVVNSVAALIVLPVLAYLILWSLKLYFKRSGENRPFREDDTDDRTSDPPPADET